MSELPTRTADQSRWQVRTTKGRETVLMLRRKALRGPDYFEDVGTFDNPNRAEEVLCELRKAEVTA